jgi:hypothetical protein
MLNNLKPAPREPYEPNQVARIVAASDVIGQHAYEWL